MTIEKMPRAMCPHCMKTHGVTKAGKLVSHSAQKIKGESRWSRRACSGSYSVALANPEAQAAYAKALTQFKLAHANLVAAKARLALRFEP